MVDGCSGGGTSDTAKKIAPTQLLRTASAASISSAHGFRHSTLAFEVLSTHRWEHPPTATCYETPKSNKYLVVAYQLALGTQVVEEYTMGKWGITACSIATWRTMLFCLSGSPRCSTLSSRRASTPVDLFDMATAGLAECVPSREADIQNNLGKSPGGEAVATLIPLRLQSFGI